MFKCINWTCVNESTFETAGKCTTCHLDMANTTLMDDINRVFVLAQYYIDDIEYTEDETFNARTKIESIRKNVSNLFFKDDSEKFMSKMRKFHYSYGLLDTFIHVHKNSDQDGSDVMYAIDIDNGQLEASSINYARKKATDIAIQNDDIKNRFAYEQPQWTDIYQIPSVDMCGTSRIFKRDVDNTGKVAYIHVSWGLTQEK